LRTLGRQKRKRQGAETFDIQRGFFIKKNRAAKNKKAALNFPGRKIILKFISIKQSNPTLLDQISW
jgi:hypothetical protein